jgi:homospermidine synthase
MQAEQRLMMHEITGGMDELGVLLMGHPKGAYWYGSRLDIDTARSLAPYNNATSMQVTSTVLGGIVWTLENPNRGLVEPDEVDFRRVLDIATPYLGEVVGAYGDWSPLQDRNVLFPEDIDEDDPWQFKNFRVN